MKNLGQLNPLLKGSGWSFGIMWKKTLISDLHEGKKYLRLDEFGPLVDMATLKRWQQKGQWNYEWRNASHFDSTPCIRTKLFGWSWGVLAVFLSKTMLDCLDTLKESGRMYQIRHTVGSGDDTECNIELNPPATSRTAVRQISHERRSQARKHIHVAFKLKPQR